MALALDRQRVTQLRHFILSLIKYPHQVSILSWYNRVSPEIKLPLYYSLHSLDQPIPHTASCTLNEKGHEAYFALAYQSNVVLYTMNCASGQVTYIELKESYTVPRILTNITGAFR